VAPLAALAARETLEANGQRRVGQRCVSVTQVPRGRLLQLRLCRLQQPKSGNHGQPLRTPFMAELSH
jgi:hypothetical protein